MLTKDQILTADDRRIETVDVPEWGGPVGIKLLTLAELDAIQQASKGKNNAAAIAVRIIVDAEGNRIFTDDDAARLANKSMKAVTRVINAFNELNGFEDEAIEAAEGN